MNIEIKNNNQMNCLRELGMNEMVQKADEKVINFLSDYPPEVGHGYSHLKKVARECYLVAKDEGLAKPELMYLVGLGHDLYRPAEGKNAQEDHEKKSGEFVKQIFSDLLTTEDINLVVETIVDHDQAIKEKRGTKMMEILSLVDKKDMNAQRWMGYAYASNKNCLNEVKPFKSFKDIKTAYSKYRTKALGIFGQIEVNADKAIKSYLDTYLDVQMLIDMENSGKITFEDEYQKMATKEAQQDVRYLKAEYVAPQIIKRITSKYSELLETN